MKLSFSTLFIVVLFSTAVQSFSQENIEHIRNVLERDPYGVTPDVKIQGNYAYITEEHFGLRVVDISNPQSPMEVGKLDVEIEGYSLEIRDHYVLLVAMGGLLTIDVEDPENPEILNTIELEANYPHANIILADDLAFVKTHTYRDREGDFAAPLKIIDISNILEPQEISTVEHENDHISGKPGLAVLDNILFNGRFVYDISNPEEPELIGELDMQHFRDLEIVDNILYCTRDFQDGFQIYHIDINDLENPMLLYTEELGGAQDVDIIGDLAFIAWSKEGIFVYDISDPENSHIIGNFNRDVWMGGESGAQNIEIVGDLAYVQTINKGLRIVSITDIEEMHEISKVDGTTFVNDVVSSEGRIFIATGSENWERGTMNGQLSVMQTDNPLNPALGTIRYMSKPYKQLSISGDRLYMLDLPFGNPDPIDYFDISDPDNPQYQTSLHYTGLPLHNFAVQDNYMLANYRDRRLDYLSIFDISNPDSSELLNEIPIMSEIKAFDRKANLVCVANAEDGLRIFDITDPEHLVFMGLVDVGDVAIDVKIFWDYALVACAEEGLKFVDISDPEEAYVVNIYQPENNLIGIELHGDFAFLLEENNMIEVLNITDIINPELLGIAETEAEPTNIAVNGQILYVAQGPYQPGYEGHSSLGVYDCNGLLDVNNPALILPDNLSLMEAFPNPFNSNIRIDYTLHQSANYRLSVFNINGKEVSVLGSGINQPGNYSANWNANTYPSGIYFLKLEAENTVSLEHRIVLVR